MTLSDLQRDLPPLPPLADTLVGGGGSDSYPDSLSPASTKFSGVAGDGAVSRVRHIARTPASVNYPSVELEPASPHRRPNCIGAGGSRHQRTMTPHDLISATYPAPVFDAASSESPPSSSQPERADEADADDDYDEGIEEGDGEDGFGRAVFVVDSPYIR